MENFLKDNKDILFHLEHMDLERIIELKEDNYAEKDVFAHAPVNEEDARDNYKRVMEIIGEICGEHLAPAAPEIDEIGVKLVDGEVVMAPGTEKVMDMLAQADLMGFSLPRKYGGLNMPVTMLSMAAEIVARADASFLNFGLQQDIAETLCKFGSDEQKAEFLPQLTSGSKTSSMILTEPDAGSDLQAVNLKATMGADGKWYLNGVKRFITNGNGEIGLVLARSEDAAGARGLSFFLYERDDKMIIRRLEDKLGIHGSPTCELQFNNAPALLVGERRRGLTKYTMWLMNSARLGIAAQAVGIAEASYREADKYAREREQFGGPIINLPPVYEMLTEMKVGIEAGRSLLYQTARYVDMKEGLEHLAEKYPERSKELKAEIKKYTRLASLFTPITKAYCTEMANKAAYDGLQIHGGTGYMRDFNIERHYRDARITNIYEGTTQLQIVAAIGGVTSGTINMILDEYAEEGHSHAPEQVKIVEKARNQFEKALAHAKGSDDKNFVTFHSRRLVEMAIDLVLSYLLLRDAKHEDRKMKIAVTFIEKMASRVYGNMEYILNDEAAVLNHYQEIIG